MHRNAHWLHDLQNEDHVGAMYLQDNMYYDWLF